MITLGMVVGIGSGMWSAGNIAQKQQLLESNKREQKQRLDRSIAKLPESVQGIVNEFINGTGDELDLHSCSMNDADLKNVLDSIRNDEKVSQRLTKLNLGGNTFKKLPSGCFAGLMNLKWLNLALCTLETMEPNWFKGLRALEFLALTGNWLNAPDKDCFDTQGKVLRNLKDLELDGLMLKKIDPAWFEGLENLQCLNLSRNNLNEDFTRQAKACFKKLTQLKKLNLSNNQLTKLDPIWFTGLQNLEQLDLSENNLANYLTQECFSKMGLGKLKTLNLSDNGLTIIDPRWFVGLNQLTELDFSSNELSGINQSWFMGLNNLTQLNLSFNNLAILPSNVFENLSKNITKINLAYCQLSKLDPTWFKNLKNLEEITLVGNTKLELPPQIRVQKIQFVDTGNNEKGAYKKTNL